MTAQFTADEIAVLMAAVRLWENQPSSDGAMSGIFGAMLDSLDPEWKTLDKTERDRRADIKRRDERNKIDAQLELRRETSVLLQGKLIALRGELSKP